MQHINYNSTERHSDVTKASPMTPLKQFVFDIFFLIIIEFFILIN